MIDPLGEVPGNGPAQREILEKLHLQNRTQATAYAIRQGIDRAGKTLRQVRSAWVKEQRNSWHGVDYMYHGQMDFDTFYKRYCETLLGVDDSIGRVLDCLKEMGQLYSTLV